MRKGAVPLIALLSASLTGCMPQACPAIGWSNGLTVELAGDASRVHLVEVCSGDVCSRPIQRAPDAFETAVPKSSPSMVTEPEAAEELSSYFSSRVDDDTWEIGFNMDVPSAVTVCALSSDGKILAEEDQALEWTRVGGSERWGGPMETDPVVLNL
ncbi:hypothetical protein SAMN04489742_3652 [Arthrobacter crystallopoietes]|uniref:Uncharacterized protein n=2 Tax=Crystallibacter crystallopoietes TaxID=37928 RepID=A0A1H1FTT0_9MICC|nr:hypothetical protein AC20117_21115 [Arthrobacter crystallopoietes]SDR04412.1 hypothetical protein SAMN04489742_3652 [Arthrobacter crystallopoietes]